MTTTNILQIQIHLFHIQNLGLKSHMWWKSRRIPCDACWDSLVYCGVVVFSVDLGSWVIGWHGPHICMNKLCAGYHNSTCTTLHPCDTFVQRCRVSWGQLWSIVYALAIIAHYANALYNTCCIYNTTQIQFLCWLSQMALCLDKVQLSASRGKSSEEGRYFWLEEDYTKNVKYYGSHNGNNCQGAFDLQHSKRSSAASLS